MWSILTRLEAWHWIKGGAYKGNSIQNAVGLQMKRMRCPESEITDMIRLCLHHNPTMRPTAEELAKWAHKQGGGKRRSGRAKTRAASTQAVVRVLDVPSATLLSEEKQWSGSVLGLLSVEETPVPPIHGCAFQATVGDQEADEEETAGSLTIRTTALSEDVVTEDSLRASFEDVDEDHNGALSKYEVKQLLQRGGIEWSTGLEQELANEWVAMAGNDEHEVDFAGFFQWWTSLTPSNGRGNLRREMHKAFAVHTQAIRHCLAPCFLGQSSSGMLQTGCMTC